MNKPIGILDSGAGGLTVLKDVASELPHESIVYIGDSKNTPYGAKSAEEIYRLAKQLIEFLITKEVKVIVVACNTITVSCLDRLRSDYPEMPIVGTVPVIKTAAAVSHNKRIGILSTTRTAQSDYQKHLIEEFASGYEVFNHGTDELVPLIEEGKVKSQEMTETLKRALSQFATENVDTIALGCTHFPFLRDQMQEILGDRVRLLDSGSAIAKQVRRVLEHNHKLSEQTESHITVYTTGDLEVTKDLVKSILEKEPITVEKITM